LSPFSPFSPRFLASRRLFRPRFPFESLSKYDSLRWSIEELLREYAIADRVRRRRLAELVGIYRGELERLSRKERRKNRSRSLYGEGPLLVPSLFNSGCATGKHGFTALEIDRLSISLQHWSGDEETRPNIAQEALYVDRIEGGYSRFTLKTDNLDQVYARIELLGGAADGAELEAVAELEGRAISSEAAPGEGEIETGLAVQARARRTRTDTGRVESASA
jgi:hypothetical protein